MNKSNTDTYRKKPVQIQAIQWTLGNHAEVMEFCHVAEQHGDNMIIRTLEGHVTASPLDWILCGVQGEFYPCKPDIFEQTYDPVY